MDERDPSDAFEVFTRRRRTKTRHITLVGRHLASSIFQDDPQLCRTRDERARQSDHRGLAVAMAAQWSAGLPLGRASNPIAPR
jgi:hypothetical protein